MKYSIAFAAVLASGFVLSAAAQTAAPAGSSKVAVISFEAAVSQTNEFQRQYGELQKKFEPKRTQLKTLSGEIETLTKDLQAQGDKLSEAERSSRTKTIGDKRKAAQRLAEDAQNDFQHEAQRIFSTVAVKVDQVLNSYARQQGYTLVVDSTQQPQQASPVLYASPSLDITKDIVAQYNAKPPVAASPAKPAGASARPSGSTGHPAGSAAHSAGKSPAGK